MVIDILNSYDDPKATVMGAAALFQEQLDFVPGQRTHAMIP